MNEFAYDYNMNFICKGLHMSIICGEFPYEQRAFSVRLLCIYDVYQIKGLE